MALSSANFASCFYLSHLLLSQQILTKRDQNTITGTGSRIFVSLSFHVFDSLVLVYLGNGVTAKLLRVDKSCNNVNI